MAPYWLAAIVGDYKGTASDGKAGKAIRTGHSRERVAVRQRVLPVPLRGAGGCLVRLVTPLSLAGHKVIKL
jgi:hypothetical protein